jgi:HSP20 family molecular chaperone IbpA
MNVLRATVGKEIRPYSTTKNDQTVQRVIQLTDERLPGSGNIRYEPPVRQIIDEGNHVMILAELPDIDERKIRISLENNILTLAWHDPTRRRQKREICLPCRMRFVRKRFQDGILEISLERIAN